MVEQAYNGLVITVNRFSRSFFFFSFCFINASLVS